MGVVRQGAKAENKLCVALFHFVFWKWNTGAPGHARGCGGRGAREAAAQSCGGGERCCGLTTWPVPSLSVVITPALHQARARGSWQPLCSQSHPRHGTASGLDRALLWECWGTEEGEGGAPGQESTLAPSPGPGTHRRRRNERMNETGCDAPLGIAGGLGCSLGATAGSRGQRGLWSLETTEELKGRQQPEPGQQLVDLGKGRCACWAAVKPANQ